MKQRQEILYTIPTESNAIQLSTTCCTIISSKAMLFALEPVGANWYEHGEKNNKHFLNIESKKMSNSCVCNFFDKGGKLTTSPKLTLSELYDFYIELYSNRCSPNHNNASDAFLDHCRLPLTLNEDAKQICDAVPSKAECFKALQMFKNRKSPGNDGLTAEFYQVFMPTLGHLLVDSLNSLFEKGELAKSQKQGTIKLIEKKNKNNRYFANWRPISLLNVDVKIASKAITLRLEKVLSDLISADQHVYVKGRNIFSAEWTIGDIMDYTKLYNLPGLMVIIDFAKAFDS